MNQLEVLVHFEGSQNWCAVVRASNFEKITVLDMVTVALARYNAVFHTDVKIDQLRFQSILDINKPDVPLKSPELEEVKSSDYEISVLLPDYEAWAASLAETRAQICQNKRKEILKLAETFMTNGYYGDARDLMLAVGDVPADTVLEKLYKKVYEGMSDMITRPVTFVKSSGPTNVVDIDCDYLQMNDKVFSVQRSVTDIRDDVLDSSKSDEARTQDDLMFLAESDPKLAVALALQYPSMFAILPKLCDKNEKCVFYFMEMLVRSQILPRDCLELAENFQKAGQIDIALELLIFYQDIDVDPNVVRFVLWFLLVDNRLARFQSMIRGYLFRIGCPRSPMRGKSLFDKINGVVQRGLPLRKVDYKVLPATVPLVMDDSKVEKEIDKQMIPISEITALYCFMSGALHSFVEIRNLLAPFMSAALSDKRTLPITRTFLYACSAYERIKENVPLGDKVVAIGDETAMLLAYQNTKDQGTIMAYPIPALMIANLVYSQEGMARSIFWNRVKEIDGYETLILCIGANDLITTVPQWLLLDKESEFGNIFESLIQGLVGVIEQIRKMYPNLDVVVHYLFFNESTPEHITRLFNSLLEDLLPQDIGLLRINGDIAALLEYRRESKLEDRYGQRLQEALCDWRNGESDED